MKRVNTLAALCLFGAALIPAEAGQPGKKPLKPIYTAPVEAPITEPRPPSTGEPVYRPSPAPKPRPAPQYQPAPAPQYRPAPAPQSHGPTSSDLRNESERQRLIHNPPPSVSYTRTGTTHYRPAPTTTTRTTRRYVTQQPSRTYTVCPTTAPRASHCHGSANTQPGYVSRPAPQPHYTPAPQPVYPPNLVKVQSCDGREIRRLKNGRDGERRYEVCYSDLLHLPLAQRNSELLGRIDAAAGRACRGQTSSVLYSARSRRNCESDAIETAVLDAGVPGFADYYYRRTGKKRPNVKVGDPIYY